MQFRKYSLKYILHHNISTTSTTTKQDLVDLPGRCFGCFLCPPSDEPDSRSPLDDPKDSRDPAGLLPTPSPRSPPQAAAHAGDPVPGPTAPPPEAAAALLLSAAGRPGKKSATPNGSSGVCSPRSGLIEGEFGKVSAGPAPTVPAAEPGLLLLRRDDVHLLPLESPEDLCAVG